MFLAKVFINKTPDLVMKQINKEEFIKRAKEIHGNKYDYSKVNYVNNNTKVSIICPKHGEFWQTPSCHLSRCGCPICGGRKKLTKEEFIERAKEMAMIYLLSQKR